MIALCGAIVFAGVGNAVIVCHCNLIMKSEIVKVIEGLLNEDCWRLIVPLQIYHVMSKRGKCCSCFPGVVDLIVETTAAYHKRHATPEAEIVSLVDRIQAENEARERARKDAREKLRRLRVA